MGRGSCDGLVLRISSHALVTSRVTNRVFWGREGSFRSLERKLVVWVFWGREGSFRSLERKLVVSWMYDGSRDQGSKVIIHKLRDVLSG